MLPSRGLIRSASCLGAAKSTLPSAHTRLASQIPRSSVRRFGTTFRSNNGGLIGASAYGCKGAFGVLSLPTSAASSSILSSIRQVRHASTQPPPPTSPPVSPKATPDITDPSPLPDFSSSIDLTGSDLLNMPEQLGYLKTLGLDFGWGPTSLTQYLLEHAYVMTGLPWWASIGVVALITRGALFWPLLKASENTQKMSELKKIPAYAAAQKRMQEAMLITKDPDTMLAMRREVSMMHRVAGIKMWWHAVPLLNAVFAFGMIRLMRAMAALPVPSLENGGLLWFQDLTAADPFYILPVASGLVMFAAMRMSLPYLDVQGQRMLRAMGAALLPIGILCTSWLPAGIQFYFFSTAILHWIQQALTYNPTFRSWWGLMPLSDPNDTSKAAPSIRTYTTTGSWQAPRTMGAAPKAADESLLTTMKKAWDDKVGGYAKSAGAKSEVKKSKMWAQEYKEKKALEDKEDFQARMERKKSKRLSRD